MIKIGKKLYNRNYLEKFLTNKNTHSNNIYPTVSNLSSYQCSNVKTEPIPSFTRTYRNIGPLNLNVNIQKINQRKAYYSNRAKETIRQLESHNREKRNALSSKSSSKSTYSKKTNSKKSIKTVIGRTALSKQIEKKPPNKEIKISLVKKKPIQVKKKSGHITNIKIISTESNQPKEIKSISEESNKERCKTETNDMIKIKNQGRAITKIEFIKNKYRALCNNITL